MDFMSDPEWMERESSGAMADDPECADLFKEYRGSVAAKVRDLPWRDVEQSVLICVCRFAGADTAIALDYRDNKSDPRVIASSYNDSTNSFNGWQEVRKSFSEFQDALGMSENPSSFRCIDWLGGV